MEPITLGIGIVTTVLVQLAKKISAIPLSENNKKAIRTIAAILSFGGVFGFALANGTLEGAEFTNYLGLVAEGIVAYFVAYLTYKTSGLTGSKNTARPVIPG